MFVPVILNALIASTSNPGKELVGKATVNKVELFAAKDADTTVL